VECWTDQLARQHGFTDISHNVDIFGTCPRCARRANLLARRRWSPTMACLAGRGAGSPAAGGSCTGLAR
jgi:hypothetical protein